MKKTTLLACAMYLGTLGAGAQNACNDVNGYPQSKNTGGTGAYTLMTGFEENAAQTYNYSGPGKISGVRLYGYTPNVITGVNLTVRVYNVDVTGRPTTVIGSKTTNWGWGDNMLGHKDVSFNNGGYSLSSNFAVSVEIVGGITSVTQFQVTYDGNGEGRGEDLASLAGTSTGYNWASAENSFSKDGDFYIIPKMKNYVTAGFTPSTICASTNGSIAFTNTTTMTKDSMFNKIALAHYSGTNHFYTWNFGDGSPVSHAVNPTHSYSVAGVYSVTLTSMVEDWSSGCSNSITKVISVGLNAGTPSVTNVTCNGSLNGSFTVAPTGGASPYSYSNNNGDTYVSSAVFSGLAAGVYSTHVKDALGCDQLTTVIVTEPTAISFASPTTTNASCANLNGGIQLSATGGSGALQYSINGSTWQGTGNFSNLGAGTYTVWAKDANGCTNNIKVTVNNVGGPTLSIVSSTNVNCFGNNNASIVASATGGTSPIQYSINGTTFQNSGTFNGLAADTFYVTVKDGAGCLNILPVVVSQPSKLNFTSSSTPVLCNGGSTGYVLVNNVTGGTGTMVYAVDGSNYQSGNSFSGLVAGVHTTYVKDAAGCVATNTVLVTQPSVITTTVLASNPACNSTPNGNILVIAGGGTPGYSYSMNGEDYFPEGDFEDLYSGAYTITIKDANGCWTKVYPTLTQPSTITSTVTVGNSTCGNLNGNILIAAAGGSGSGYQYSINGTTFNSNGSFTGLKDSTYNILVQDGSGCSKVFTAVVANSNGPVINSISSTNITCNEGSNGSITITNVTGGSGTLNYQLNGSGWQTATSFTGLSAGLNTIIVKDGLGCTGSYQVTLTQPAAISVNVTTADLLCSGVAAGSATISAGGGSGTMAYSMNGNFYQSSNMFMNLAAGNYQAYVRDAGGCINTNTFTITSPTAIIISNTGVLDVTCHGAGNGAINVVASGGTGNLQYSLDGSTYQAGSSFSGLNGGNYTLFVQDNNGCVKTQTVAINEPAVLSVSTVVSNVSCAGGSNGSIVASAIGGTSAYTYMWSGHHGGGSTISNISAGTYILTVIDQHDCINTSTVTVSQPANPLIINATVTDASGSTSADGSINATVTGGTPFYTYNWSNNATTPSITGLTPGTYIVNVTDMNGCITSGVYNVGSSTGIQNVNSGSIQIKMYPNPTDAFITLESDNTVIDQVEVLNLIGDVLYNDSPKTTKVSVNLSGLVEGMYFVRYHANNTYTTKRVELIKH